MYYSYICFTFFICTVSATYRDFISIPCTSNEWCKNKFSTINDTYCLNGKCICPIENDAYKQCTYENLKKSHFSIYRNTESTIKKTCNTDNECHLKNGHCNNTLKQCLCNDGFVISSNGKTCLKVPNTHINGSCTETNQCLSVLDNTICDKYQCKCIDNYYFFEEECVPISQYNEACIRNKDCASVEGAICSETLNTCICPEHFRLNVNFTKCIKESSDYGSECVDNQGCMNVKMKNVACINSTCQCIKNYYYHEEMKSCLHAKVQVGEACSHENECYATDPEHGHNVLTCTSSHICECISGYHSINNKTIEKMICVSGTSSYHYTSLLIFFLTLSIATLI